MADYIDATKPTNSAVYKKPTDTTSYNKAEYTSQYQDQVDQALNKVVNWEYNPLEDASYQSLAKIYNQKGNLAAQNTLGDAASLNGGYGTSYAVSAAQQQRNQYNQELASYIPELEEKAYNRASTSLSALRDAEDTSYNRYRDTVSDNQWQYTQDYTKYRDEVSDAQYDYSNEYQKYRDAMSDYQWAANYNLDVDELKKAEASSGSSSGAGYVSDEDDNPYLITDGTEPENKKNNKNKGNNNSNEASTLNLSYWTNAKNWKSSR